MKKLLTPKYLAIYLVLGVVVYGLVYYFFFSPKAYQNRTQYVNYNQNVPTQPKQWRLDLKAQNGSKLDGSALLTEVGGKTKVVLSFQTSSTLAMPAHIHLGSCPNPGAVKYSLTFVIDGRSETVIPVTIDELKKQLPLSINVHKSVVDQGIYVSCGDLK